MPVRGTWLQAMGRAAVYSEAKKALGGIDTLINNASGYESRLWFETTRGGG